jgi:hypothetical protein
MPAPIAAGTWQLARAQPARTADEIALVGGARARAHGACGGQEQIEECAAATPHAQR